MDLIPGEDLNDFKMFDNEILVRIIDINLPFGDCNGMIIKLSICVHFINKIDHN